MLRHHAMHHDIVDMLTTCMRLILPDFKVSVQLIHTCWVETSAFFLLLWSSCSHVILSFWCLKTNTQLLLSIVGKVHCWYHSIPGVSIVLPSTSCNCSSITVLWTKLVSNTIVAIYLRHLLNWSLHSRIQYSRHSIISIWEDWHQTDWFGKNYRV